MAENSNNKTNNSFFKDIIKSVKDFDKYEDFALESVKKSIVYILKIIAIFALVVTIVSIYQFSKGVNQAINYFNENISNLDYADGILQINNNEKLDINNEENLFEIIIDTQELNEDGINEYKDYINSKNNIIIILRNKIFVKNAFSASVTENEYSELLNNYNIESMDKQQVLDYINSNKAQMYIAVTGIVYIYMLMEYFISVILDIVMLALITCILGMVSRLKIKFKAGFGIATHALTLSLILNLIYIIINSLTGFTIKYFSIMYMGIAYVYIITAIFMIKSDFIKRQVEVEKIKTEQEKVHEELESKKEQEKDKKQEEKNKREREKQKDKEKKEEQGETEDKPEGSNA